MNYTITLSRQELGVIFAGLGELPLKAALHVFGKLQSEVQKQDAENAENAVSSSGLSTEDHT